MRHRLARRWWHLLVQIEHRRLSWLLSRNRKWTSWRRLLNAEYHNPQWGKSLTFRNWRGAKRSILVWNRWAGNHDGKSSSEEESYFVCWCNAKSFTLSSDVLIFHPHQKLYHHENPTYCDVGIIFRTCRFTLQRSKRPTEDKVPSSLISNRTIYYSADWPGWRNFLSTVLRLCREEIRDGHPYEEFSKALWRYLNDLFRLGVMPILASARWNGILRQGR